MNWTEPKPPTEGVSSYDHTKCETPLGEFIIEWKSWKLNPSYDVILRNEWIGCEYDLDQAKNSAKKYLEEKKERLIKFLK